MSLTSRSWIQITASSAKFTLLARHRKKAGEILAWVARSMDSANQR